MHHKYKDVWELLPWDIQIDMLGRLSTKDLLKGEEICKNWQSIIKSPKFHMLQIKANPNQDAIIMHSIYEREIAKFNHWIQVRYMSLIFLDCQIANI